MAFAAIAAVVTAEAVTVTMALAAVAEIGTVMTVVGAVTGNKELMKIGGTMALVGGIGSMAVGATSGAAAAEGALASEGTGALLKGIDSVAGDAFSGASLGGDAAISSFSNSAIGAATDADIAGGLNPNVETTATMDVGTTATAAPKAADAAMPVGPDTSGMPQAGQVADNTTIKDNTIVKGATGPGDISSKTPGQSSSSFFGSIGDFAEKNKNLVNTGMQLIGGAMNGANQSAMWDQKMALENEKLKQTSYGSQVGNFAPRGILATGAR